MNNCGDGGVLAVVGGLNLRYGVTNACMTVIFNINTTFPISLQNVEVNLWMTILTIDDDTAMRGRLNIV